MFFLLLLRQFLLIIGNDMIGLLANGLYIMLFASRINHIIGFLLSIKINFLSSLYFNNKFNSNIYFEYPFQNSPTFLTFV